VGEDTPHPVVPSILLQLADVVVAPVIHVMLALLVGWLLVVVVILVGGVAVVLLVGLAHCLVGLARCLAMGLVWVARDWAGR
jgi:hypothetical protein